MTRAWAAVKRDASLKDMENDATPNSQTSLTSIHPTQPQSPSINPPIFSPNCGYEIIFQCTFLGKKHQCKCSLERVSRCVVFGGGHARKRFLVFAGRDGRAISGNMGAYCALSRHRYYSTPGVHHHRTQTITRCHAGVFVISRLHADRARVHGGHDRTAPNPETSPTPIHPTQAPIPIHTPTFFPNCGYEIIFFNPTSTKTPPTPL